VLSARKIATPTMVLAAVCVVVTLLQNLAFRGIDAFGLFIPDSLSMSQGMDDFMKYGLSDATLNHGVDFLYWAAWLIHPALSLVINTALLCAGYKLLLAVFRDSVQPEERDRLEWLALLGLLLNPSFFLVASGPNKDIPAFFLTMLFIWVALRPMDAINFAYLLLISFVTYTFRDGYGAGLLCVSVSLLAFKYRRNFVYLCALMFGLASAYYSYFLRYSPILQRNEQSTLYILGDGGANFISTYAIQNLDKPFVCFYMYYLRLTANAMSLVVRAPLINSALGLSVKGLAIWVFGVAFFWTFIGGAYLISSRDRNNFVIAFSLVTAGIVSISLYNQPRYLMAVFPAFFVAVFLRNPFPRHAIAVGTVLIFFVYVALIAMRLGPPLEIITPIDPPSFLLLR